MSPDKHRTRPGSPENEQAPLNDFSSTIQPSSGENVEEPIEQKIGPLLRSRGLKLALAESCTGGLVGDLVTNVSGSSDYFIGGVMAYAYEAKRMLLGVRPETLERYGAVSRQTVLEMAQGARKVFSGNEIPIDQVVALSVSGIAGPGGGMTGKPVGLVWIGLSAPDGDRAWHFIWDGDRLQNKVSSAKKVLSLLSDYLQGSLPPESSE
jgi:nicotinamide-nucleotide amidase